MYHFKNKDGSETIINEETGEFMTIIEEKEVKAEDIPVIREIMNINKCPKCGSKDTWKYGFEYESDGKKQRRKCKKCAHVWKV